MPAQNLELEFTNTFARKKRRTKVAFLNVGF